MLSKKKRKQIKLKIGELNVYDFPWIDSNLEHTFPLPRVKYYIVRLQYQVWDVKKGEYKIEAIHFLKMKDSYDKWLTEFSEVIKKTDITVCVIAEGEDVNSLNVKIGELNNVYKLSRDEKISNSTGGEGEKIINFKNLDRKDDNV